MSLNIYLSGEIHTDWRQRIIDGCKGNDFVFTSAVTNHEASDAAGDLLGEEEKKKLQDKLDKYNPFKKKKGGGK